MTKELTSRNFFLCYLAKYCYSFITISYIIIFTSLVKKNCFIYFIRMKPSKIFLNTTKLRYDVSLLVYKRDTVHVIKSRYKIYSGNAYKLFVTEDEHKGMVAMGHTKQKCNFLLGVSGHLVGCVQWQYSYLKTMLKSWLVRKLESTEILASKCYHSLEYGMLLTSRNFQQYGRGLLYSSQPLMFATGKLFASFQFFFSPTTINQNWI